MLFINSIPIDISKPSTEGDLVSKATKEVKQFYDEFKRKKFPVVLRRYTGESVDAAGMPNSEKMVGAIFQVASKMDGHGLCLWSYSPVIGFSGSFTPHMEVLGETINLNEDDYEKAFFLIKKSGLVGVRGDYKIEDPVKDDDDFAESQAQLSYVNTMLYAQDLSPELFTESGELKVRRIAMAMGIPRVMNLSINQVKRRILNYTQATDIALEADRRLVIKERTQEFKELLSSNFDGDDKLKYLIQKAEDDKIITYNMVTHEYVVNLGHGASRHFFSNKSMTAELRQANLLGMLKANKAKMDQFLELIGEFHTDTSADAPEVDDEAVKSIYLEIKEKGGWDDITVYAQAKSFAKRLGFAVEGVEYKVFKEKVRLFLEEYGLRHPEL